MPQEFSFYPGGWGLFHIKKGWITKPKYYLRGFDPNGSGLIWATTGRSSGGPYGLLRADGTWQVKPQYSHVQRLMDERAVVRKLVGVAVKGQRQKELNGAVDPTGKLVVPLKFEWLSYWENGFGLLRKGNKRGLVDKFGNILGGRLFEKTERMGESGVARVMIDEKWLGLDRQGNLISNPEGERVVASCPFGVKLVKKFRGYQAVGVDGKPTTQILFDYAPYFAFSCDRPNAVRIGKQFKAGVKWSFLGTDGRLLFDPPVFDGVYNFSGGHAIVKQDGKWGIVDTQGRFSVKPEFDKLKPAGERIGSNGNGLLVTLSQPGNLRPSRPGLFEGTKDGRSYVITATGQEKPALPKQDPHARYLDCGFGMRLVSQKTLFGFRVLWGIADKDGRMIVTPKYRAIHCFHQGVAYAAIDLIRQWCPIGPDDRARIKPSCVIARYPFIQTHSFPEKFADDAYENSVQWTRAYLAYGSGKRKTPPRMIGTGGNGGVFSRIR